MQARRRLTRSVPQPSRSGAPIKAASPRRSRLITYFAALDVAAKSAVEVADLMRAWTMAAARMTLGETARPVEADLSLPAADSGEALDLGPARLTLTFGFGPTLFIKDGKDRFGWGSAAARGPGRSAEIQRRPAAAGP